jgi:hypothetical protein
MLLVGRYLDHVNAWDVRISLPAGGVQRAVCVYANAVYVPGLGTKH